MIVAELTQQLQTWAVFSALSPGCCVMFVLVWGFLRGEQTLIDFKLVQISSWCSPIGFGVTSGMNLTPWLFGTLSGWVRFANPHTVSILCSEICQGIRQKRASEDLKRGQQQEQHKGLKDKEQFEKIHL